MGGRPPPANRTPAQMAAEAALRRLRDDLWCHTDIDGSSGTEPAAKSLDSDDKPASSKVSQPQKSSGNEFGKAT